MRFRKSISILKGLKMNVSKSGVSLTAKGGRGVSANLGREGLFLNTSIPGTGLYDRKKIMDFGEKARRAQPDGPRRRGGAGPGRGPHRCLCEHRTGRLRSARGLV